MTRSKRQSRIAAVLLIAILRPLGMASADEVQVNTYTTSFQWKPSVAMDAQGGFVIVWESAGSAGTDTSLRSCQGQRFASDGSALGSEFQVNSYTDSIQGSPEVAMDADGDFVVVWTSFASIGMDTSVSSVQGQRYSSDGSAAGDEFQINTFTTDSQSSPAVAIRADGEFVAVWSSAGSSDTDTSSRSIQSQRYAVDGFPVAGEFQINSFTTGLQGYPSIAVDLDGDFIVVWQSESSGGTDASEESIHARRYASDGSAMGDQFQVNTYTTGVQSSPRVATDAGGNFVIVWESYGSEMDFDERSVQGQRYAADGSQVGGQFQVNSYTTGNQEDPVVAMDADGDFVVVWHRRVFAGTGPDPISIRGQRYASNGSPVSNEFLVNCVTTNIQSFPAVATDADGNFLVAWNSNESAGTDTDNQSIQRRGGTLEILAVEIFSDGFESGDTSVWPDTLKINHHRAAEVGRRHSPAPAPRSVWVDRLHPAR